jgi:hypothetical protein
MTRTRQEVETIVNKLGYSLIDEYEGRRSQKRVIIQNQDGYKWDGEIKSLINSKQGIRFFEKRNPYTIENISNWLPINRPEFELCDGNTYRGNDKRLIIFHNIPECQENYESSWSKLLQGYGCAVCRGFQVGKYNNLAYKRPDLAKEWHPDNEKRPEEVVCGHNAKVYWICSIPECRYGEKFEWHVSPSYRVKGRGCPACSGRVVTDKNRLSIKFSRIASEWNYEKNSDTPDDVSCGVNKKRYWICPNGHNYSSLISNRTRGHGCKQCSDERKESIIATELKEFYVQNRMAEKEYEICTNPETGHYLLYDIYIPGGENPEINGRYIEVHGHQHFTFTPHWHKTEDVFEESKKRDRIKKKFAKKNGKYIGIDLRRIKTTEEAIHYIENILTKLGEN